MSIESVKPVLESDFHYWTSFKVLSFLCDYCAMGVLKKHCNGNVISLMKSSSLAVVEDVILKTFSETNDEGCIKMTRLFIQCIKFYFQSEVWFPLRLFKTLIMTFYFGLKIH